MSSRASTSRHDGFHRVRTPRVRARGGDLPEVKGAAAHQKRAIPTIDNDEKFLLFDPPPDARLPAQRAALLFYLDAAIRLRRTLVLPRWRLHGPTPSSPPAYAPFGSLFNVSTLNRRHPAVELDDFLRRGRSVDVLTRVQPSTCRAGGAAELAFNGVGAVRVGASQCAAALHRDDGALRALRHTAIAFAGGADALLAPAAARALRPYVRFEQSVYDAAAAFVDAQFGAAPFVVVDWRRLFVKLRHPAGLVAAAAKQSAHEVARHAVRRHVLAVPVGRAFLATDISERAELAHLHAKLRPARLDAATPRAAGSDDAVAKARAAHVEVAVCAMASYFLGSDGAPTTAEVLEERLATFGHAEETAALMGDDHERGGAAPRRRPRRRHPRADACGDSPRRAVALAAIRKFCAASVEFWASLLPQGAPDRALTLISTFYVARSAPTSSGRARTCS